MTPFLASPLIGLPHGFFSRHGGVSEGGYATLNCGLGSGDAPDAVTENRRRVRDALEAAHLLTLYQIHSPDVITVTAPWADTDRPRGDAMVTTLPGIALGVLAADCTPVLFADEKAGVIGAAHAGWQGTLKGVVPATLAAMRALGATTANIRAAIGPSIRQPSYEVGAELHAAFTARDPAYADYFAPAERPSHFMLSVAGIVGYQLRAAEVAFSDCEVDTYPPANGYYSYRRATHLGENVYGRGISAIALPR